MCPSLGPFIDQVIASGIDINKLIVGKRLITQQLIPLSSLSQAQLITLLHFIIARREAEAYLHSFEY